ncbi:MAG TPA: CocE/NonD family hydrolase [Pyrinomonadaceae bacterium]|nr:CocE/NonD family hydrolase [Pyrinomonadaceae bacterium]
MKPIKFLPARTLLFSLLCLLFARTAAAQEQFDIRANYGKHEYRIVMRDGAKLFTAVYAPRDKSRQYPIMINRTPYAVSPYGEDKYRSYLGPSLEFTRAGYIFVYQDVRGKYMSEGEYVNVRPHKARKSGPADVDESTDTYDTIDWLVKNVPNNNGRVGMWGISYPGFYAAMGLLDAHPALKASSPQAPIADWFIGDDFHHNGTLFLPHGFNFLSGFGLARPQPTTEGARPTFKHGTPDGYKFFLEMGPLANADRKYYKGGVAFWNEMMAHPNYDEYWKARSTLQHFHNVRPAVLTVGGWFDAEDLYGALKTYESIEKKNPGIQNRLVMGPWCHGCWARTDGDQLGDIKFGTKTGEFYREKIELPFFECALKDRCGERLPEAYVFETGSNRWRKYDEWPPKKARETSLYLEAGGRLSFNPPAVAGAARGYDEYVSDPARPVPHINVINIGMTGDYMIQDQRFASRRPDVLVYQTAPLKSDLTIAGPVTASLFVSTSGTDSDFVVKLIDVFPDDAPDPEPNNTKLVHFGGYQMLVRGEPMRARFRNSFERPEAMVPNQPTKLEFVMPDASHTFLKGHRIMVQIQSTWFPLVDRNPQKFVDNINRARESDFQKATQRVHHGPRLRSAVRLMVLP